MRPTRLIADGFTAFRDPVEIDFTSAEFFALVGPTGSGKSSVLDAICFALYGSIPRYNDDRLVAPAITQGANEARVSLTFEIDGEEYVATRVVRRTTAGGATTKEARLEHGNEVLAGNAKELTEATARLIGLPFDHFTRCVALPQGEFAQFLHDKPSDRQDLVIKLLDLGIYERMQQRARALVAEGKNAMGLADQRLGELRDCTVEAEDAARQQLDAISALRTQLKSTAPRIDELAQQVHTASAEVDAADRIVASLIGVKLPKAIRTLADRREAAVGDHREAERERSKVEREATTAAKAIEGLPDPGSLESAIETHDDLAGVREEIAQLDTALAETQAALTAAQEAHAEAEHALGHAAADHEVALHEGAAAVLSESLKVGEPCPVCLRILERKPKRSANSESKTKKALEQARTAEASTRNHLAVVSTRNAELASDRRSMARRAGDLQRKASTSGTRKQLEARLGAVRRKRQAHDDAQGALHAASTEERRAQAKITEINEKLAVARVSFQSQRDPLVSGGLEPPAPTADLVADWGTLVTWSTTQLPIQRRRKKDAETQATKLAAAAEQALDQLMEAAADAGVQLPKRQERSIATLREAAAAAERDSKHELDRVVKGRKESARLKKQIATTRQQVEVADELARLLRSNNFEQWLVNEALERLMVGASETLEALSSNQYALAVNDKNEFEVIDHRNADERRPAKTLSGGETFQASLALALALADQLSGLAAHGVAKLDAIFLDEGFGTLDADSVDTVAATLETLGADDRMVGIITHVRDLAERVPTRFEVAKGPRTSTVTRVDG